MEPVAIVSFHAPTEPDGWVDEFAAGVIADKLAAGVNITPGVRSVFWWKSKATHADELLVEVTTRADLIPAVSERILSEHPYELPGIRTTYVDVNPGYHQWVIDSTD